MFVVICRLNHKQGVVITEDIRPKSISNSNFLKSRYSITYFSVGKSFWNFAHSTAVSLLCSVQIFKTIWQRKWMFGRTKFELEWVSNRHPILKQHPDPGKYRVSISLSITEVNKLLCLELNRPDYKSDDVQSDCTTNNRVRCTRFAPQKHSAVT